MKRQLFVTFSIVLMVGRSLTADTSHTGMVYGQVFVRDDAQGCSELRKNKEQDGLAAFATVTAINPKYGSSEPGSANDRGEFLFTGLAENEVWTFTLIYKKRIFRNLAKAKPPADYPVKAQEPPICLAMKDGQLLTATVSSPARRLSRFVRVAFGKPDDAVSEPQPWKLIHLEVKSQRDAHLVLYGWSSSKPDPKSGNPLGPDMVSQLDDVTADGDGTSVFDEDPGHKAYDSYFLVATKPGFKPYTGIIGRNAQSLTIPKLERSTEFEQPLNNVTSPARGAIYMDELRDLPLLAPRDLDQIAALEPGILPAPQTVASKGPGLSPGVGVAGQFSVNGLRSRENNFRLDGSDNNDEDVGVRRQGFVFSAPAPIESIAEYHVLSGLYDARFGRNIGGQVNAITRAGGAGERRMRDMHGRVYGFFSGNPLDARNFFDPHAPAAGEDLILRSSKGVPVLLDNQPVAISDTYAGQAHTRRETGGFVLEGRLPAQFYISGAFEKTDSSEKQRAHFAVPTVAERGIFLSGERGLPGTHEEHLFPSTLAGDAVFSLYPFANDPTGIYGANTYTTLLPADESGDLLSIRLDRAVRFLRSDSLFTARYNRASEQAILPSVGDALYSSIRTPATAQNLAGLFSSSHGRFTNTFRFSWGKSRFHFSPLQQPSILEPSLNFPDNQFLLNAPLLVNETLSGDRHPHYSTAYRSSPELQGLIDPAGRPGVVQTEELTGPIGQVRMAGFSALGVDAFHFPQQRANQTFQWSDDASYHLGSHLLTAGLDIRYLRLQSQLEWNQAPVLDFYGQQLQPTSSFGGLADSPGQRWSPSTVAAAGFPSALRQTLATSADTNLALHRKQIDFFLQDDWRIAQRLTLNFGIRFNINRLPESDDNRFENEFDRQQFVHSLSQTISLCEVLFGGSGIANRQRYCADTVNAFQAAFPVSSAGTSAGYQAVFNQDAFGWDPRLGFAWDVWGRGSMVVRGGWGLYTGQFPAIILDESRDLFPRFLALNYALPPGASPVAVNSQMIYNLANPKTQGSYPPYLQGGPIVQPNTLNRLAGNVDPIGLMAIALNGADIVLNPVEPAGGLKNPHSAQFGLTIDQKLGRDFTFSLAYVGTEGRRLLRVLSPSAAGRFDTSLSSITAAPAESAPSAFPSVMLSATIPSNATRISPILFSSAATSHYHSLQAALRSRWQKAGLNFGTAFTYSHAIDDASDFFDNLGAFALAQDSISAAERASSNFDVRLRSITHFVWTPGGKIRNPLLRAWQLSGIVTLQTGQPFTVNSVYDVNQDGNLTDRLNMTTGLFNLSGDRRTTLVQPSDTMSYLKNNTLNPPGCLLPQTAVGSNPYAACDGAVGRNTYRAGGIADADVAVAKELLGRERARLVFRTEFFNLLNRTNYALPIRILEAPGFGQSVRTVTRNRTVQLSLRLDF